MIRIDGPPLRLCDGVSRRTLLQVGGVSALGLSLSTFLQARAEARPARDLNCIMLWLWGAPSHLDTWDMKPDQSEEIRGLWKPIRTSADGVRVVEHLPSFARQMHRITQVRTMFN